MRTHLHHVNEGTDGIAAALATQLLDGRNLLPQAANNRAPTPRERPLYNTRVSMRKGRCLPFHHLLAIAKADLEDGVPFATVIAPFRQLQTEIEVMALQHANGVVRPLPALVRLETKAQARFDLAELRVVESPTSVEALTDVLREAANYETAFVELTTGFQRQLAISRGQPRPQYGQRLEIR